MKCFDWQTEVSEYLGSIKRPIAEIAIKDINGIWRFLFVYVDSGADVTIIQRSFAKLLGIPLEQGRYAKFGGVGGGRIEAYIHSVEMMIGEYIFKADVAFAKSDRVPNLLGRLNIFNLFEICFKNKSEQTCFYQK